MAVLDAAIGVICPNVNADAVKEIIDTDLTDIRINNFINAAYYTSLPLADALDDCGGTDALCSIIIFLSAHFMTTYERQTLRESIAGEWSVSYAGKDGIGLDSSLYGQQAKAMDCSGTLATLGLKGVVFQVTDYHELETLADRT